MAKEDVVKMEGDVVEVLLEEVEGVGSSSLSFSATTPTGATLHPAGGADSCTGRRPGLNRRRRRRSTHKSKCSKKSAPKMGNATAAKRNLHLNISPTALIFRSLLPQHFIGERSAAIILGPLAGSLDV